MITYASYNPPSFPILSNVLTVALCNSGTELFAGLTVNPNPQVQNPNPQPTSLTPETRNPNRAGLFGARVPR
jgi:SNF family Na+-dependent transporter